jgi:hypothetical protein
MLHVFMFVCVFDECMVMIYGLFLDHMLEVYVGCVIAQVEGWAKPDPTT